MIFARTTRRIAVLLFITLFASLCLGGCAQKKEMDGHVDAAIKALQSGKRSKLDKLLTSSAKDDLGDDKFDALSGAIKKLGTFDDRTMSSIEIVNDKMEGQYTLDFAKGKVSLNIVVIDGRIAGLNFEGGDFEDALEKAKAGGGDDDDDDDDDDDKKSKKKKKKKKSDD